MLALAILSLLASAAMAYVIGAAVIARRDSFLRTKRGVWLMVIGALSFVTLPPQLTALGGMTDGLGAAGGAAEGITAMVAWPSGISTGAYLAIWLATSLIALLVGMRIWNARKPDWRSGGSNAMDSSAVGRVRGLLPLSDSLDDALDTIARSGIDARGAEQLAEELRGLGRRFAPQLPEGSGAVYNLVAKSVSPAVASIATRHLLEGVAERAQRQGEAQEGQP